jgi:hypothetical protein
MKAAKSVVKKKSLIALGGGYSLYEDKNENRVFLKIDDCKKFEVKKMDEKTTVIVEIPQDFLRWL